MVAAAAMVTELMAAFRRTTLSPITADPAVRTALEKYAADFGREAAGDLLEYCRRQVMLNAPGHSREP